MKPMLQRLAFCMMMTAVCLLPMTSAFAQQRNNNNRASQAAGDDGSRAMGTADIQYDAETGSIIVITDEETNEDIKSVIATMDRPTPQVLIKVLFLEVTHVKGKDIGVQYALRDEDSNGEFYELSTAFGLGFEPRGGFLKVLEGDLQATIRAIGTNSKLEVLSRPSILARNNQDALITVGQEVPFITNSRITSDGQTINTIQYSDVGIILQVRPRIMPDGMVEMVVSPEISNLTAETVQVSEIVSAPVIAKRSAETSIVVQDGKTVVIGGMMENNSTEQVTKIPLLGDIPYLGALFRRTITEKGKTELLIFLTPMVVDGPDQLESVSTAETDKQTLVPKAFSDEQFELFMDSLPVKQHEPKK